MQKLAAALLQLNPGFREWAKTQPAESIVALYDCHHYPIPVALDGDNHPTNLMMILRPPDHQTITRTIDVPAIAKVKRITESENAFRQKILAKSGQGPAPDSKRRKWPSRPFPKKQNQGR